MAPIVGIQGGTEAVRRRVADLRASGAEVAGVWLQDWTGQRTTDFGDRLWWTWQLDRERYPGWERLVADLGRQGIRVTTYVNPFLVDAGPKGDPDVRNLYAEAADEHYLVEHQDGSTYLLDQGGFDAALVDLTDPDARAWFADVIAEEVLGAGVAGFMADFGEGLPFDAEVEQGDPRLLHNRWPRLWAQTVRQACEQAGRPDCLTWFRSGSLGMGEDASLFWNGDQLVDFGRDDGLASALLGTFSAGVSGWPLVHSDVGGYTSVDALVADYVRDPRLLQRWSELAAFGVVMRTHEGNRPDDNPQVYDDEQRPRLRPDDPGLRRAGAVPPRGARRGRRARAARDPARLAGRARHPRGRGGHPVLPRRLAAGRARPGAHRWRRRGHVPARAVDAPDHRTDLRGGHRRGRGAARSPRRVRPRRPPAGGAAGPRRAGRRRPSSSPRSRR